MRQYDITIGPVVAVPVLSAGDSGVTAILQADAANTANVYIGDRRVTADAVRGLRPGQERVLTLAGGEDLYGISTAAGQLVRVLSAPSPGEFEPLGGQVEGLGIAGTPAGGVQSVQSGFPTGRFNNGAAFTAVDGVTNGAAGLIVDTFGNALQQSVLTMIYNGATWDRPRTPAVFKSLNAVVITAETTIWTPTAGKKFRLMGYAITQGVVTGPITLKDNTAGATILVIPPNTIGVVQVSPSLGNGILSAAANNVLTATGVATETITGYAFGTEE